jgi:hypothetical protein
MKVPELDPPKEQPGICERGGHLISRRSTIVKRGKEIDERQSLRRTARSDRRPCSVGGRVAASHAGEERVAGGTRE